MADWAKSGGVPYADLKKITQPVLVTNGNNDTMIPTVNSFTLSASPISWNTSRGTFEIWLYGLTRMAKREKLAARVDQVRFAAALGFVFGR